MRHAGRGRLLVVVGRQPVILRADIRVEEGPGAAGHAAQKPELIRRQPSRAPRERTADVPGDHRGGEPEEQDRPGRGETGWACQRQAGARDRSERGGGPHPPPRTGQAAPRRTTVITRRRPLEEPPVREEQPRSGAQSGIEAEERLVRKTGERQQRLGQLAPERARAGREMASEPDVGRLSQDARQRHHEGGERQEADAGEGPSPGGRQLRPRHQEQTHQRRGGKAAAEIVEEFPSPERWERIPRPPPVATRHAGQQPAPELPVAADPAMTPPHVVLVAGRVLFVHLHVGQQPGARVAAFEQVVTEDPVLREPAAHSPLERVHVVDALADEGPFAEQVLVDVGHHAGIRVDARLAGPEPRVPRPGRAGKADGHPGLKDAVTGHHALLAVVVLGPVERVHHGADHEARGVSRQIGVGVERDDVLHLGQNGRVPDDAGEPTGGSTAQERVQLGELPALALVAHPEALLRIPPPGAVKEEELAVGTSGSTHGFAARRDARGSRRLGGSPVRRPPDPSGGRSRRDRPGCRGSAPPALRRGAPRFRRP